MTSNTIKHPDAITGGTTAQNPTFCASERSGSNDLLCTLLKRFPFQKPSRILQAEDGEVIAEWQWDGKYFEISIENGDIEIMARSKDGVYRHYKIIDIGA